MSTQQQRQEWRELAAAATPGEWRAMEFAKGNGIVVDVAPDRMHIIDVLENAPAADAAFIAAARAAVPALLADVDALTQERDALAAELEQEQAQANIEWQEEHAARLVLAEQLKAAEQRAEALRAQLAGDTPEPMLYKASTRPLWTDDAQA